MEKEKIGKYIRKKRIEKGMTQQQLAEKIQVTEKAVSRWETGRGVPDISLLEPLAEELHVSVTELLNGEERVQEEAVHDTKAHMADMSMCRKIGKKSTIQDLKSESGVWWFHLCCFYCIYGRHIVFRETILGQ